MIDSLNLQAYAITQVDRAFYEHLTTTLITHSYFIVTLIVTLVGIILPLAVFYVQRKQILEIKALVETRKEELQEKLVELKKDLELTEKQIQSQLKEQSKELLKRSEFAISYQDASRYLNEMNYETQLLGISKFHESIILLIAMKDDRNAISFINHAIEKLYPVIKLKKDFRQAMMPTGSSINDFKSTISLVLKDNPAFDKSVIVRWFYALDESFESKK